jgi:hypothetical protein
MRLLRRAVNGLDDDENCSPLVAPTESNRPIGSSTDTLTWTHSAATTTSHLIFPMKNNRSERTERLRRHGDNRRPIGAVERARLVGQRRRHVRWSRRLPSVQFVDQVEKRPPIERFFVVDLALFARLVGRIVRSCQCRARRRFWTRHLPR